MKQIDVGIIGTGWCGGIRAQTCAANPLVKSLHLAEIRPERLAEVAKATGARTAVTDYRELLGIAEIEAIYISATPETTHYPMARDCLAAGKHVFLEKPIALELAEADELIALARERKLKFTIGYSQRFNPKFAYVRKSIRDGSIGRPVSALVSRHITRNLGKKISGRIKLSPAAMEATHDLDFVLWCLEPAKPIRVYSQINFGTMRETSGAPIPDTQWITVTMDSGVSFVIGAGWTLPPGYPNFSTTWIEFIGTEGAVMVDDSHRDVVLNTMAQRHGAADVDDAGRSGGSHLRRPDGRRNDPFPGSSRAGQAGAGDARARADGDGGLHRGGPLGRDQPAGVACRSPTPRKYARSLESVRR